MSTAKNASAMQSQMSQKNPLSSTAMNGPNINLMGQTILNTVYQDPNQNLASTVQTIERKRSNSFKNQSSNVNSQANNNIANTVNISKPLSRASNTPNRVSSNEAAKTLGKTQKTPSNAKTSKFNKTIVKDGKTITNIDLNDDTQSTPASHNSSKVGKTVMNNSPPVQSFQLSKQGSPSQSSPNQNQNMPTISQQARAFPGVFSTANIPSNSQQNLKNTQQQSLKSNIQPPNQSLPQSIQSQKQSIKNPNVSLPNQKIPIQSAVPNLNSQKNQMQSLPPQSQIRNPAQSTPIQGPLPFQKQSSYPQSNPQSMVPQHQSHASQQQLQSMAHQHLSATQQHQSLAQQSLAKQHQSMAQQSIAQQHQSMAQQHQSLAQQQHQSMAQQSMAQQSMAQQHQSMAQKQQSMAQQQQSMAQQQQSMAQQGSQIRQSNAETQSQNNNNSQANNKSVQNQNKSQTSQSKLMRKSSLKASRNKSPPQVIRTSDGKIKRTEKDSSGNRYYVTTDEQNIVSDSYISTHLNEYLNKEIELTKSKVAPAPNNKKGNGFRYYGQLTKAGRNQDGKTKTDQDTPLVHLNVGGIAGFNLFGVLDGHGPHGHFVSQFCREYFIKKMTNYAEHCVKNKITTPEKIYNELKKTKFSYIVETFAKSDSELSRQKQFDVQFSGTTCNIVFQFNKYLVCASVGDSRGLFVEDNGDPNNVSFALLSHDHKPDLPSEMNRIHLKGGMVDRITDFNGEKVGPPRVWKAGCNYPGLAMSRSLGDFQAKECGVITTPEIIEYIINKKSRYLVVCSDGVWEFIQNEQVVSLGNEFYKKNDVGGFCSDLVKFAVHSWEQFDIIRDDITVVCVYF